MRLISLLTLAGALVLAGCHRAPEEPEELNNSANETAPHNATAAVATPAAASNAADKPAPPLNFSDDAQMRDDADATGLTARVQRDGDNAAATHP